MKRKHLLLTQLSKRSLKKIALLLSMSAVTLSLPGRSPEVLAALPDNACLNGAAVQINKVRYLGKSNGDDQVSVEWQVFTITDCIPFGGGKPVDDRVNVAPFGYELTVKIKRRLGNEDTAKVIKREIITGKNTTIVTIPRATLETDPVSFTATIKTTAGSVQTFNRVITGLGAPSLAGATQSTNKHSTVPSVPDNCFSSVSVSAINFLPGSGTVPDNIAINYAGSVVTANCNDVPRFKVKVIVRRPAGNVDTVETISETNLTNVQLQIPGAPAGAIGFNVTITALSGNVVEKTDSQSGDF